jgi:uncharacterized protein (TIGR00251 family)
VPKIYVAHPDGITLNIYVQASAYKTSFAGAYNNRLKLKVSGKAVDGEANQAVLELIANSFSVPKGSVSIVRGSTAREKTIQIAGTPAQLVLTVGQILANCPDAPEQEITTPQ